MSSTILYGGEDSTSRKTFFNHVFSTTDEGKADLLNIFQYAFMGFIPVLLLYHLTQYLIPEVNTDKSSIEIIMEIVGQVLITFGGMVIIHRSITYFPTYSEFKYDSLSMTTLAIIALFLMLSIRTKLGVKATILYDRAMEMWHGPGGGNNGGNKKKPNNTGVPGYAAPGYVMQQAPDPVTPGILPGNEPRPASTFGGVFGGFK